MDADYGYKMESTPSGYLMRVSTNTSAMQTVRRAIGVAVFLLGLVVAFSIDGAAGAMSRSGATPGLTQVWLVVSAAAAALWFLLVRFRKPAEQHLLLAKYQLTANRETYAKKDIMNLSVWSPGGSFIVGTDAAEVAVATNVARSVAAERYAVTFDYGRKQVIAAGNLTGPQANAVAAELHRWLTA